MSAERLEVWKRAKNFALKIYREVLPLLPIEEKWALNQQIRRSCTSISANIAEGHGRFYYQENVRFCYIARGSLEETLNHLIFCHEVGFIPTEIYEQLEKESNEISRMLNGYIAYIKKSKQGDNEPGANLSIREYPESYIINPNEAEPDFSAL